MDTANSTVKIKEKKPSRRAICVLEPSNSMYKAGGLVEFEQVDSNKPTEISFELKQLKDNSVHGFHIHTNGNLYRDCIFTGGDYNPFGKKHGDRDSKENHVGDLGNIEANSEGIVETKFFNKQITLFGEYSVIGRACILHEKFDDLGNGENGESRLHGNVGKIIACGVIGINEDENWN